MNEWDELARHRLPLLRVNRSSVAKLFRLVKSMVQLWKLERLQGTLQLPRYLLLQVIMQREVVTDSTSCKISPGKAKTCSPGQTLTVASEQQPQLVVWVVDVMIMRWNIHWPGHMPYVSHLSFRSFLSFLSSSISDNTPTSRLPSRFLLFSITSLSRSDHPTIPGWSRAQKYPGCRLWPRSS